MYRNAKIKYAFGKRLKVVTPEDLIIGKLCKLVGFFNHDDARDILALATENALNTDYLCGKIRSDVKLKNALLKVVADAKSYRYRDFDLSFGTKQISVCLSDE